MDSYKKFDKMSEYIFLFNFWVSSMFVTKIYILRKGGGWVYDFRSQIWGRNVTTKDTLGLYVNSLLVDFINCGVWNFYGLACNGTCVIICSSRECYWREARIGNDAKQALPI